MGSKLGADIRQARSELRHPRRGWGRQSLVLAPDGNGTDHHEYHSGESLQQEIMKMPFQTDSAKISMQRIGCANAAVVVAVT